MVEYNDGYVTIVSMLHVTDGRRLAAETLFICHEPCPDKIHNANSGFNGSISTQTGEDTTQVKPRWNVYKTWDPLKVL